MSIPEWRFTEPPELVDLDRLWRELRGLSAIHAFAYLGELRSKAPVTYERLRQKRLSENCLASAPAD